MKTPIFPARIIFNGLIFVLLLASVVIRGHAQNERINQSEPTLSRLPSLPAPLGIPRPALTNDAPYAPQAILLQLRSLTHNISPQVASPQSRARTRSGTI